MRTLRLATASAVVLSLLLASSASADPDANHATSGLTNPALLGLITNDDVFSTANLTIMLDPPGSNGTQHYGPYPSGSPDSGTCGNDWANDTFDRNFTVKSNQDGTFTVIEQFKNGSFTTIPGASPGACETNPGGMVGNVVGSMHGYFIIPLPPGTAQTSTDPHCDGIAMTTDPSCTTATFINTHFDCNYPVGRSVTTFFFHYSAGDQGLVKHEWKNASDDRGGNSGDIAN